MENPITPFPNGLVSEDGGKGVVINGSAVRKRLADISNLQRQPNSPNPGEKQQQVMTREYVDKLQKENAVLVKMVGEGNKIIELNRIELQKLKVNLQMFQKQNLQLARANSQMLAGVESTVIDRIRQLLQELNSGKDRLKVLQHELGCKNGILRGKQLELEERATHIRNECVKEGTTQVSKSVESFQADRDNRKPHTTNRKRQSCKSCPDKQDQSRDEVDKRRSTSRRQSARFRSEEPNPSERAFEIDDSKFPVSTLHDGGLPDKCATLSTSSVSTEDRMRNAPCQQEPLQPRRSSVGRPSRQAAQKIQSYKERPINVKMRREA